MTAGRGLTAFVAARFDLVMSDVVMPELSGYELCRRIKALPEGGGVPVILLTSLGKPEDMIRGLECGADSFIMKPYEDEDLVGRIGDVLASRALAADREPGAGVEMDFMGERFTITSGRSQILRFLAATFEDFVRSTRREHRALLALKTRRLEAEAEAHGAREDLLRREGEALRGASRFLQATLDALSTRIAILDETGGILAVNAAWSGDDGHGPLAGAGCRVGANYLEACGAAFGGGLDHATAITTGIGAVLGGQRAEFSLEYPCRIEGDDRWFGVRATRFREPGPVRVVVAYEDITQRKMAEGRLHHDAFHDVLTGLPNRALFADRLKRAQLRSLRHEGERFAVLFLDLDGFKVVNDSLGHAAGDQLLVAIARRLQSSLRRSGSVARLGGDEFAILDEEARNLDEAASLAERVRTVLRAPFRIEGREVVATASIGIALAGAGSDRQRDLLRDADTAMYQVKATGRDNYAVFDPAMQERIETRVQLESDLRRALGHQEFRVHYQPIISLMTGRIAGFEALARWQHPVRGHVGPSDFLSVAEESGMIVPLGLWVLREACLQMRAWQDDLATGPSPVMSVNLSRRQLAQPDLVEQVDRTLRETGLDPRCLRLEVTESVAMGDAEAAIAVLGRLKGLGIRLSLDGFGTGYSSLEYLHRFPLDALKVDRSFIARIDGEGGDSGIVRAIVALAHSMAMEVVAEGVETAGQVGLLRRLGCEYGQGYYFSRPIDREEAGALLRTGPQQAILASA